VRIHKFSKMLGLSILSLTLVLPVQGQNSNDLPALGDTTSGLISLQQEKQLGQDWLRQLRAQVPTLDDPILMEWFHDLIYRLVPDSQLQTTSLQLVTLDSGDLNAFAVPGGIVGINYGLLLYSDDEDQVASVLAHELAHLSQRHFARQVEAAQKRDPVALATLLASLVLIATSNTEAGIAGMMSSQAASIQNQLAYSRDFEREADRLGMNNLVSAGFSPDAMPNMFSNMQAASRYRGSAPEFLQTHPLTTSRVADAAGRAAAYTAHPTEKSFRFRILRLAAEKRYVLQDNASKEFNNRLTTAERSGLTAEADALRYALASIALSERRNSEGLTWLADIHKPNLLTNILQAQLLAADGQSDKAVNSLRTLQALHPGSLPLKAALADILLKNGDNKAATPIWRELTQSYPEVPRFWESLSQSAERNGDLILAHRALAEYHFAQGQNQEAAQQLRLAISKAQKSGDLQRELALKERLKSIDLKPRR